MRQPVIITQRHDGLLVEEVKHSVDSGFNARRREGGPRKIERSALIEAISEDSTGVEAVCVWASALMWPVIIGTAAAAIPAIASRSFLQLLDRFNLCISGGGLIVSVLEDFAAYQIDAGPRVKKWPRL